VYGSVLVIACYIALLLASFSFQNVDSTSKNPLLVFITATRFLFSTSLLAYTSLNTINVSASLPAPISSNTINVSASICDPKNKNDSSCQLFLGSKIKVKNKR